LEPGGSSGAHGRQLESGVHGGLMTNSRWRRIFAKVEFVVFVSNIVYELGYV
jgi:hypothetical protein